MSEVEKIFRLPVLRTPDVKLLDEFIKIHELPAVGEIPMVDPKQLIGVEVEIERVLKIAPDLEQGFWMKREDGSLRNKGLEFVSHPIPAAYVPAAVYNLFRSLNKTIEFSRRTSVHIHLNVRKLTLEQVVSLLCLYYATEKLLFGFVGGERHNNIFCVPLANSDVFNFVLKGATEQNIIDGLSVNSHKYSALNIVPIKRFGTLEFRHMPGNSDSKKLAQWVNLLCCLKLFVFKNSREFVLDTIMGLNTTSAYAKFIDMVYGPYSALLDTSNLVRDMETPVSDIKAVFAGSAFHREIITTVQKTGMVATSTLGKFVTAKGGTVNPAKKRLLDEFAVPNVYNDLDFEIGADVPRRFVVGGGGEVVREIRRREPQQPPLGNEERVPLMDDNALYGEVVTRQSARTWLQRGDYRPGHNVPLEWVYNIEDHIGVVSITQEDGSVDVFRASPNDPRDLRDSWNLFQYLGRRRFA